VLVVVAVVIHGTLVGDFFVVAVDDDDDDDDDDDGRKAPTGDIGSATAAIKAETKKTRITLSLQSRR
jgi:hypothetical protein